MKISYSWRTARSQLMPILAVLSLFQLGSQLGYSQSTPESPTHQPPQEPTHQPPHEPTHEPTHKPNPPYPTGGGGGYCRNHPNAPECSSNYCEEYPNSAYCSENFCEMYPADPRCDYCTENPQDTNCVALCNPNTSEYQMCCSQKPTDPGCVSYYPNATKSS